MNERAHVAFGLTFIFLNKIYQWLYTYIIPMGKENHDGEFRF